MSKMSGVTISGGTADFNVDPLAGRTIGGKIVLPLSGGTDSVINHLWYGVTIASSNNTISYSFMHTPGLTGRYNNDREGYASHSAHSAYFPGSATADGYYPFTPEQEAAARAAIQLWDDLIPQHFVETNGNGADIQFGNSNDPGQAYAIPPYWSGHGSSFQGDVFTHDPVTNTSNAEFGFGQYGATTLIHEIGHTLGLSHPGNYNASDDNDHDGVPDPITYANDAEYYQDDQLYTIMSYFRAYEVQGFDNAPLDWRYSGGLFYDQSPQGPMLHDIYTIQAAYGADPTTRSGATTYGFHSTAGNALYDFNQNSLPYYAVYDAGGTDTIDLSGFSASQYLNMNAGKFSSIGDVLMSRDQLGQVLHDSYLTNLGVDLYKLGYSNAALGNLSLGWLQDAKNSHAATIQAETGVAGIGTVNYDTFAIAYNTTIENAVGGQGRDLIVGNGVANRIDGQGGSDVLQGGAGDDTLIGGLGNDTLSGGGDKDVFVFAKDGSTDTITDFQTGIDKIDLSAVVGATASYVSYNATTHQVQIDTDHDGVYDMFINSTGTVNSGDYLLHG